MSFYNVSATLLTYHLLYPLYLEGVQVEWFRFQTARKVGDLVSVSCHPDEHLDYHPKKADYYEIK